ncbi:MAG: hypothetical protein V1720_07720, partial [bacterium]
QMNYWGFGIDFGIPLFSIMDLKIVEGGVTFLNTEFKITTYEGDVNLSEVKYNSDESTIAYYISSGFILHIIPNYISIEGSAQYSIISIDKLNGEKVTFPILDKKKMIEAGGFGATVQLNVGIPF